MGRKESNTLVLSATNGKMILFWVVWPSVNTLLHLWPLVNEEAWSTTWASNWREERHEGPPVFICVVHHGLLQKRLFMLCSGTTLFLYFWFPLGRLSLWHLMFVQVFPQITAHIFGWAFFMHTNVCKQFGKHSGKYLPVSPWIEDNREGKRKRDAEETEVVQAAWPQELPLFFVMKDCRQGYVWQQWLPLENSDRIWMEVLSSSLTKDQHYLYSGGYASNFSEVTHRSPSNRPKCNILRQAWLQEATPKLQKSKCVEVTFSKHWGSKISHHHFSYAVNYIKCRLCNAYTTPYSSCLECPLTSQDLFSSPVPVNYTKWCVSPLILSVHCSR